MDWDDVILAFLFILIALFVVAMVVAVINADRWAAERDCEEFTTVYGDYFNMDSDECMFEFESRAIAVEFDEPSSHIIIQSALE